MIKLNIIPTELKKSIRLNEIYNSLNKIGILIVLIFAVFIGIYYASYIYLELHMTEVTLQSANLNKNTENYSNKIADINTKLKYIEKIQKNNIKWIDFLTDFSSHINDGVILKSLTASKSTGALVIRGEAKTRDSLLEFEKSIKSLPYLTEINIPLKNLLEKEDIAFDIKVKINLYEFAVK